MISSLRIGVDLLGSDTPPVDLFEAVLEAACLHDQVNFVVFISPKEKEFLSNKAHPRIQLYVVNETIEMQDEPLVAIRQKKRSSLVLGLKFLKKKHIQGFVSAGNTGALIAGSTLLLPLLPGIKRPALLAVLPSKKHYVAVIDVGGNVACKAHHLVQFALMGAAFQRCYQNIAAPKIGLLNIGLESKKGTSEVRRAYQMLQDLATPSLQFIGNVEGRDVFQGDADVIVTDGFTGNVLLKTSEGISSFLLEQFSYCLKDIPLEKKENIFKDLRREFDYEEYNGAIICGVDAVAVKCHGKSTPKGLLNGIKEAISLVKSNFIDQIKSQL